MTLHPELGVAGSIHRCSAPVAVVPKHNIGPSPGLEVPRSSIRIVLAPTPQVSPFRENHIKQVGCQRMQTLVCSDLYVSLLLDLQRRPRPCTLTTLHSTSIQSPSRHQDGTSTITATYPGVTVLTTPCSEPRRASHSVTMTFPTPAFPAARNSV